MNLWTRISTAVSALASGEGLAVVLERLRGGGAPAPERSVAFTIAIIALGAKMAKADGQVTRDEVSVFRRVFAIPPGDEANAARVFNLARQDIAGFETYAARIAEMFRDDPRILTDVLEGLFLIAVADGEYHPAEDAFLLRVAGIFGLQERCFRAIRARHVADAPRDPYDVLGVSPDQPLAEIRAAWKQAVRDSHPDRMIARGVPAEVVHMAERRLVDVNTAWEQISSRHAA